ncbi:MAG: FHA domain-containing protein [Planctomycetota bacterium]|nr:FHA domain-containing protein [Planctomycetota bacterium]
MARLRLLEGGRERIIEVGDATVRMGRSPDNPVALEDMQASRNHCEVEKTSAGFKLIDLESKNGTKVNGKFINQHLLVHLDRIEIGDAVLLFEDLKEAAVPVRLDLAAPIAQTPLVLPQRPAFPTPGTGPRPEGPVVSRVPFRRPRLPAAASSILFFAIFVAIVLGIVMYVTKENPELARTRQHYNRGMELAQLGKAKYTNREHPVPLYDIPEFEEARAELEQISSKFPDYYRNAQEELGELKSIIERANAQRKMVDENKALDAIQRYALENPEDAKEILRRCEEFKTRFPKSTYLGQIDTIAAQARDAQYADTADDFAAAQELCKTFINYKQYGRAVALLNEFVLKTSAADQKTSAETLLRETISDAESFFELKHEEAQKLRGEKKYADAVKVYETLLACLGDESVHDFDELRLRAQKEINRLKEQKQE